MPVVRPARIPTDNDQTLAMALLRDGIVAPHHILQALSEVKLGARLVDTLLSRRLVAPDRLYASLARFHNVGLADLRSLPPDPRLIDRLGANFCLAHNILPWRDSGGLVIIACASVEGFQKHYATLISTFGPVAQALAPPDRIASALLTARGPQMRLASRHR